MPDIDVTMRHAAASRVVAEIAGETVFFESSTRLAPKIESALAAAFLPALAGGTKLAASQPVDPIFLRNLGDIARIACDWWGWRKPASLSCVAANTASSAPAGAGAMFFTGGVDSFCTLLRNQQSLEALINIHGFDISLADRSRYEASKGWIQAVADTLSLRTVYVATDLRERRFFNAISWEITHVAALGSVAHALSDQFGRILLASSDVPPPWGSNPALDPFWSSGSLTLINDGSELSRLDKVKAIAASPLAHRYLKVCWENRSDALNCGVCEKCVRTQAQFAVAGTLGSLHVFPKGDLAARIDGVSFVEGSLRKQWEDIRREAPDPRLAGAIDRLLRRSDVQEFRRKLRWVWRRGHSAAFGWTRTRLLAG